MSLKLKLFISVFALATSLSSISYNDALKAWMIREEQVALQQMHANISRAGSVRGVIVASPSRQDPDYYFHWVRDSALVVDSLLNREGDETQSSKNSVAKIFSDYTALSVDLQNTNALTGLGEPRFNIDATPYMGDWSRPQNDGPALRVLTLFHGIDRLKLAPSSIQNVLQADLKYILQNFNKPCFDLWEEVKGDHFYTRLTQLSALNQAAEKFDLSWGIQKQEILKAIAILEGKLNEHWNPEQKYIAATLNRIEGAETYKKTDLDTAVILGVLHSNKSGDTFSVTDDRVLSTASQLEKVFQKTYEINSQISRDFAPSIGRYLGDVYFGGNPWYLTTAAFAELNYKLATAILSSHFYRVTELNLSFLKSALMSAHSDRASELKVDIDLFADTSLLKEVEHALKKRGDLYMANLMIHLPESGHMSEQFDRKDAHPVSARDLTWSYASFLSAFASRKELETKLDL